MKIIRQLAVAAVLGAGLVSCAQAHVSIGIGVGFAAPAFPVAPIVPVVPVVATAPVYVAPPVYYAPPPPVYTAPVVVGYYGHPGWSPAYYGGWRGYGYWRR